MLRREGAVGDGFLFKLGWFSEPCLVWADAGIVRISWMTVGALFGLSRWRISTHRFASPRRWTRAAFLRSRRCTASLCQWMGFGNCQFTKQQTSFRYIIVLIQQAKEKQVETQNSHSAWLNIKLGRKEFGRRKLQLCLVTQISFLLNILERRHAGKLTKIFPGPIILLVFSQSNTR